jgi:acetyltransferase-like isoleucine patch superfamily enzyme
MITSHVVVAGSCTIEEYCFLGANATIRDETVVASGTLLGMAAALQKDSAPLDVYKGVSTPPSSVRSDELLTISHKSRS